MDFLRKCTTKILTDNKNKLRWRVLATTLAGVIVFVTTYSLILPAITMEVEVADEMPGISLEGDLSNTDVVLDIDDWEEDPASQEDMDTIEADDNSDVSVDEAWDGTWDFDSIFDDSEEWEDSADTFDADEQGESLSYTIRELTQTVEDAFGEGDVTVHLYFDENAMIPDGTELALYSISGSYSTSGNDSYVMAAKDAIHRYDNSWSDISVILFGIDLLYGNDLIIPADKVTIELQFQTPITSEKCKVLCFGDTYFGQNIDGQTMPSILENVSYEYTQDGGICKITFDSYSYNVIGIAQSSSESMSADEEIDIDDIQNNSDEFLAGGFADNTDFEDSTVIDEDNIVDEENILTDEPTGDDDTFSDEEELINTSALEELFATEESPVMTEDISLSEHEWGSDTWDTVLNDEISSDSRETNIDDSVFDEFETEQVSPEETTIGKAATVMETNGETEVQEYIPNEGFIEITELETETQINIEIETEELESISEDLYVEVKEPETELESLESLSEDFYGEVEEPETEIESLESISEDFYVEAEEFETEPETEALESVSEDLFGAMEEPATEEETEVETELPEIPLPAQEFSGSTGTVQVYVSADEGAFPIGTTMVVKDVVDETTLTTIEEAALEEAKNDPSTNKQVVSSIHAVDITFMDETGNEIEPSVPIRVFMTPIEKTAENTEEKTDAPIVIHVDNEGNPETIDILTDASLPETSIPVETEETTIKDEQENNVQSVPAETETIAFDADSFSVYALVYTVDFHWEVDGQMYEFSLPGGGFISFSDLIEVLGVAKTGENEENGDIYLSMEVPGIDNQDISTEKGINNDIQVSEATREFVADVVSVVFSKPELVDVSKVENETTVGGIKESRGLDVQYSSELTEEQISEINGTVVEPGDWALISVQPFESLEVLTVTMKTGEAFEIKVTDAQLKKTVIDAKGDTWEITVTYDDSAEIPKDAELKVREIETGTEEFDEYLDNSVEKLGSQAEKITFARFFDIEIVDGDGEKVEPKVPVQVTIEYKDSMEIGEDEFLKIIHFAEKETEIISEIQTNDDLTQMIYTQDSFSVTGTIIDGTPTAGTPNDSRSYMVIATYNGEDYIINSDGSLSKIRYKAGSENQFDVEYPMLWEYGTDNGNTYIRHRSVASYLNPSNQVAEEWAHKYLDPREELAITMESTEHGHQSLTGQASITYSGGKVSGGGYYLGAEVVDGTLRIVGQQSADDAVLIRFASVPENLFSGSNNHSVNHIDIAVEANAEIHVPLAYGSYYDADGNLLFEVNRDNNKTLTIEIPNVKVTHEDIKKATITAYTNYDSDGDGIKEKTEISDAFYITGYSSNLANEQSHGNDQVRIEGVFKVADLEPYTGRNLTGYDWWGQPYTYWNTDPNNDPDILADRLLKRIYYSISTPKVIHDVVLVDEDGNELYDANGNQLKITATATVTASFDYWNTENECPPIADSQYWWYGFSYDNWQNGWIHPVDMSGMDFRLGGDASASTETQAVEISKFIVDDLGRKVEIASPVRSQFDIYYKPVNAAYQPSEEVIGHHVGGYNPSDTTDLTNGYTKIDSTHIDVQPNADINCVYDYDVEPGMFYITEDKSEQNLPQTIIDKNGQVWTYSHTRIDTESVWRNDSVNDGKMHESKDYTRDDSQYTSIPEVLGNYTGNLQESANGSYGSTTWEWYNSTTGQTETGTYRNGFLEFYVYNVYTSGKTLDVEKRWDGTAPENSEVTVELQYKKRMLKPAEGEEIAEENRQDWDEIEYSPVKNDPLFSSGLTTELTLKADTDSEKNWKGTFYNLPKTVTDSDGNVYEVYYSAEETKVTVNGTDVTDLYIATTVKTDATGEEAELSAGKVTITNAKGNLSFVKKWLRSDGQAEFTPQSSSAVVTAELRRYRIVETEVPDEQKTVTLCAKALSDQSYTTLRTVIVKSGSDLSFSIASSKTSDFRNFYTSDPTGITLTRSGGNTITYNNGIVKNGNANIFTISDITEDITIYVNFPDGTNGTEDRLGNKGIGYYVDETSYEKPGTSTNTSTEDQQVDADPETEGVNLITLNHSNGWSFTLTPEDMDAGWHYYINTDPAKGAVITETGLSSDEYTFNAGPIITTDEDGNTVYACTNTQRIGYLQIEKSVTYNGSAPATDEQKEILAGIYTFKLYDDQNCTIPVMDGEDEVELTVTITETGAAQSSAVIELPVGTYWLKEIIDDDSSILPLGTNPQQVQITSSSTTESPVEVSVTNDYEFNKDDDNIAVDIVKTFTGLDSATQIPEGYKAVLSYTNGGVPYAVELGNSSYVTAADQTITPRVPGGVQVKVVKSADGLTWTWHVYNIPKNSTGFAIHEENYEKTGYSVTAYLDGTKIEDPNTPDTDQTLNVTVPTAVLTAVDQNRITPETDLRARYVGSDYVILVSINPRGTLVISDKSLNFLQRSAIENAVTEGRVQGSFSTPVKFFSTEQHPASIVIDSKRTITVENDENGNQIIHLPPNTNSQATGFEVTYNSEPVYNNATYVNDYTETGVPLDFVKVDSTNMTTPLEKAQFTLKKLDPDGTGSYLSGDNAVERTSGETNSEGKASIAGITSGYYEISETKLPAGYVLVDDGKVYIKVEDGVIYRIIKTVDDPTTEDVDESKVKNWTVVGDNTTGTIRFSAARAATGEQAATNATFTIGNTPGAALPNTGGPGTRLFTILGSILVMFAGVMLWRRRRFV